VTIPAGVVVSPTQPAAPAPTVLPVMPSVSAPPHSLQPEAAAPAPAAAPPVAPPPVTAAPAGAPVLNDPSLPPELQGKTVSQVLEYYNKLRDYYLQTSQVPAAPAAAQPPAAVPAAPVAAPAPAPAPAQMPSASDFWADPVAALDKVVQARLAPVTQTALQQQVVAARNAVLQAPGYAELESQVLKKLEGIPAEQLSNPTLWQQAYYLAYGEAAVQGWKPSGAAPTAPAAAPAAQPTINANPRPFAPTHFFTEPARPNAGPTAALTPEQQAMATKLGISHEDYMKWLPQAGGAR